MHTNKKQYTNRGTITYKKAKFMNLNRYLEKFEENINIYLILVTAIAFILRFYRITEIGLVQWDEGAYVRMATWLINAGGIPTAHEPPLFSILIAISFLIFGIHDYAAIIVSAFFGTISVFLIYLLGTEMYNKKVGFISAMLLSISVYHIYFSRYAMIDATFTFFYMLSILYFVRAFKTKMNIEYIKFGAATSMAFLAKAYGISLIMIAGTVILMYFIKQYVESKKNKKSCNLSDVFRRDIFSHIKGLSFASFITILPIMPWIFVIGVGRVLSQNRTVLFNISDINIIEILKNSTLIMSEGLKEYFNFLNLYQGYMIPRSTHIFDYFQMLFQYVSIIVLLLASIYTIYIFSKRKIGIPEIVLTVWITLTFIMFGVFFNGTIGYRFMLIIIPAIIILAARAIEQTRNPSISAILLILAIITSAIMLPAALNAKLDGYRLAMNYFKENIGPNDMIFSTAGPQPLFYLENTGRIWWDYRRKESSTDNVTYILVDSQKYKTGYLSWNNSRINIKKLETEQTPAAIFYNDLFSKLEYDDKNMLDYNYIKIYKIDSKVRNEYILPYNTQMYPKKLNLT